MIVKRKIMNEILLFSSKKNIDSRGFFTRAYCRESIKKNSVKDGIKQINCSFNKTIYTLRGYHYQEPNSEAKTISCINGQIFLSILNLKKKSKYYLKTCNLQLDENDSNFCYIPKKYATAFLTLKKNTLVMYYMSDNYKPGFAKGIRWNDSIIKEKWPHKPKVISERDISFENFS